MSRGLKNRNPGNIRRTGPAPLYRGECRRVRDTEFREFEAMEWGYRAMFVLLHTYRLRYGLSTAAGMLTRWAPPGENNTRSYIRYVTDAVGLRDDEPVDTLDKKTMLPFVAAMSEVENGVRAVWSDVERGWQLFYADFGGK